MAFPDACALHGPAREEGYVVVYDRTATIYEKDGTITTVPFEDLERVLWTHAPTYDSPAVATNQARTHMRRKKIEREGPPDGRWP